MYIAEQQMVAPAVGLQVRRLRAVRLDVRGVLQPRLRLHPHGGDLAANIRLCGSHAGVSIGEDGPSQMALEDLAMMRAVDGSTVLYPCDANQTAQLVAEMADQKGIVYMRTTREKTPVLYGPDERFPIGGSKVLRQSESDQVTVVGAGITLHEALKAADTLKGEGVNIRVIDLYSIKPVDAKTLRDAASATGGHRDGGRPLARGRLRRRARRLRRDRRAATRIGHADSGQVGGASHARLCDARSGARRGGHQRSRDSHGGEEAARQVGGTVAATHTSYSAGEYSAPLPIRLWCAAKENAMRHRWLKIGVAVCALVVVPLGARFLVAPLFIGHPDSVHIVVTRMTDYPAQSGSIIFDQTFSQQATDVYAELVAGGPATGTYSCPMIGENRPYYHYELTFTWWGITTATATSDAVGYVLLSPVSPGHD